MRRWEWAGLCVVLAGGAAAAVVAAPGADPVDPGPSYRQLTSAVVMCPDLTVSADSTAVASAMVAPDPPGPGAAAVASIASPRDLARIAAPGDPVSILVAGRSAPAVVARAADGWAPALVGGALISQLAGAGAGVASAACLEPRSQWWFVGTGSQLGRGAALVVGNPAAEPARFDLALFARSGPVSALASRGIDLAPRSDVRLRLAALAPDEDLLAVRVTVTNGRVAAALQDAALPRGDSPRGIDFIPPATPPSQQVWIPGIPGGSGSRELVLVNPGREFATVRTRLLTKGGPATLPDLDTLAVPAGSVVSVPLADALDGRSATLELTSDVPVTGGLRSEWGGRRRDLAWLSATPPVAPPDTLAAAVGVPAGPGVRATVTVAAPEQEVRGTLTVVRSGSGDESLLADDGPGANPEAAGRGARDAGRVLTADAEVRDPIAVAVPAQSQLRVRVPGTRRADQVHVVWRSEAGSGPALLSHVVRADGPLATGYPWWPVMSAVPVVPVIEDLGILAPR